MKFRKVVGAAIISACGLGMMGGASAEIKTHTFRFATAVANGHPIVLAAEKFGEIIKQKSGGKMSVKVYPGSALGGDVQVVSSLQGGTIDFTSMNSGILQSQIKEFAALDLPFLFDSAKEADAVVDGSFGKTLADKLPAKGLVNLAYWELGFRHLTNNKRPVEKLDELEGLKLRVVQSPIYIDAFNALGANSVPMAFAEVYSALEQKVVDGQENPLAIIEVNKFQEVQKYLTLSRHIYNPQSLLASKKTWDKLTKEEQDIITAAAIEARDYQRKLSREAEQKALDILKKNMTVSDFPPEELSKIRAKLKPVVDKYAANIGADVVSQLYAEIGKARATK